MVAERAICVLVVEDEALAAMEFEDLLQRAGYAVVGPAYTLDQASDLVAKHPVDAALLDINLRGEFVFPLAETLTSRGVAVVFLTGYSARLVPVGLRRWPLVRKPVMTDEVLSAIKRALRSAPLSHDAQEEPSPLS